MYSISLLMLALVVVAQGNPWGDFGHEFTRTPVGDAVDLASMKMLKEVYNSQEDKNVVSSPLGVLLLLAMYSAGAGESQGIKDEIVKFLGAENYDNLYSSYGSLSSRFSAMDAAYLTLASKIYVSDELKLNDEFAGGAAKAYFSEIERLNFADSENAVSAINRWAEEKTKGNIKDAVSQDTIDESVVAALFNIIFFRGHWDVPFNASNTQEKDFHVDKSTVVKKLMMHLEQSLYYHESPELGAKMIELPYRETGFRMVIVLPDEIDGLPAVVEKVATKGLLKDVFELSPAGREVHLDMPKFEIKSSLDLEPILRKDLS